MLRMPIFVLLMTMISLLSGCSTHQTFHYVPPEGKPAQHCVTSCKVASNSCMQICALKNRSCRSEMEANAQQHYMTYKAKRHAQGLPVTKKYESFLRTAGCEHSCNCIPAYNTCYRACGGKVY